MFSGNKFLFLLSILRETNKIPNNGMPSFYSKYSWTVSQTVQFMEEQTTY